MFAIRNRFKIRQRTGALRRDRLRARPTVRALEDNDGIAPLGRSAARHIRPHGSSVALAQAERLAAVDALFSGARADLLDPVVIHQQSPLAVSDGVFSGGHSQPLTSPRAQPTVANGDTRTPRHPRDRIGKFYAGGLADPLLETL